ncbi:glycosyltransferase [Luteolibacter arcticus]|uniref:Glycosyltransferase n=1 Tax=Luteolibacter arcticus TaxID=1581411 RepID=A0ABT3GDX1_9BACT|nr:glycosyltransferase [Luteolibacter arcticus]MCW1921818.1 glycosyltransferase [Luteolibacter arcticus]
MAPAISILLPFHNAAATLAEALESLLAQTFGDWELLTVDDRSDDGSAGIVAGFARRDSRVRLMVNAGPPGIVGALQTAAKGAAADWLARMDADDCCHPERLARQWERAGAGAGEVDVVATDVDLIDPLGEGMTRYVAWANSLETHEAIANARFIENPVIHPTVLMRRRAFDAVGGYREVPWAEDHDLWLRMLQHGARFAKVTERLLAWRDSADRLTRSDGRYHEKARQQMRAHFLSALPAVREQGVVIAGAGPIGKSLARGLLALGITVHGFFDVHPRRLGETIHGAEVAGLGDFGHRWRDAVLLSAVGLAGVREEIRQLAADAGYGEGRDFWCIC